MDPTSPMMPMGAAAQMPLSAADLMGPIRAPAPPSAALPPQAAGMMAGPGGTPLGTPSPMSGQPGQPGSPSDKYDIQMQADGSGLWVSKTTPPVIIGVIPAPKLPQSLQPKPL